MFYIRSPANLIMLMLIYLCTVRINQQMTQVILIQQSRLLSALRLHVGCHFISFFPIFYMSTAENLIDFSPSSLVSYNLILGDRHVVLAVTNYVHCCIRQTCIFLFTDVNHSQSTTTKLPAAPQFSNVWVQSVIVRHIRQILTWLDSKMSDRIRDKWLGQETTGYR